MGAGDENKSILTITVTILPILIPLGVHFFLICLAFMTGVGFPNATFLFAHIFMLVVGLAAVQCPKSILAVISFIVVVAMTILFDVLMLGLYFPDLQRMFGDGGSTTARTWQFSAGMVIINLILKPFTILLAVVSLFFRIKGESGLAIFRSTSSDEGPAAEEGKE